jgi:hypothetical protein
MIKFLTNIITKLEQRKSDGDVFRAIGIDEDIEFMTILKEKALREFANKAELERLSGDLFDKQFNGVEGDCDDITGLTGGSIFLVEDVTISITSSKRFNTFTAYTGALGFCNLNYNEFRHVSKKVFPIKQGKWIIWKVNYHKSKYIKKADR